MEQLRCAVVQSESSVMLNAAAAFALQYQWLPWSPVDWSLFCSYTDTLEHEPTDMVVPFFMDRMLLHQPIATDVLCH